MEQETNPWQVTSRETAYDNNWIRVEHHEVINPAGNPGIYGKVHFKNIAIGVVPVDADGYTWLVGQYRFTIDEYSWEIPEGGAPEGTLPLDSAKRELLEETGLVAETWEEILKLHLSNSVSDEVAHVFVARGLTQMEAAPEETEQLQVKRIHLSEVFRMVDDGRITDALSVAALLKLKSTV
ncbi:MAG: NUDIX hydrolase [Chitinophagaceae bacterium]|nr:MAG: NUDIX hydrolase [Chitinophagaceae bacterium]